MTWYVAAALCGGLTMFSIMTAQVWLPRVIRPELAIAAALASLMVGTTVALVEPDWTEAIRPIFLFALLSGVTIVNWSTRLIPNPFLLGGLVMGATALVWLPGEAAPSLVAAATCGLGLLVMDSLSDAGEVGMGTIKLGTVIGLFMGWPAGPLAILLYLLLGTVSSYVLVRSGRFLAGAFVPVLPFLAPAVLMQWFITHGGWMEPSLQIMLMGGGFGAFYLAHRLIGSR